MPPTCQSISLWFRFDSFFRLDNERAHYGDEDDDDDDDDINAYNNKTGGWVRKYYLLQMRRPADDIQLWPCG